MEKEEAKEILKKLQEDIKKDRENKELKNEEALNNIIENIEGQIRWNSEHHKINQCDWSWNLNRISPIFKLELTPVRVDRIKNYFNNLGFNCETYTQYEDTYLLIRVYERE